MLLLILLGLVLLTGVFILVHFILSYDQVLLGIFLMILVWAAGASLSVGILSGTIVLAEHDTTSKVTDTQNLQAINTGSSIEGSFFLGSGTVDGKRVINYITQTTDDLGTYSEVKQIDATEARIFEDSDTPTLDLYETYAQNDFLIPGAIKINTAYHFHVPTNSVLNDYQITND